MTVIWSETASSQIRSIHQHLSTTSPGYANALVHQIILRGERLARMPLIGAEVPEYGDAAIREVFEHLYRVIYRVDGEQVQIVTVIHAARQLPRRPPK